MAPFCITDGVLTQSDCQPAAQARIVALTGFMGSGKTTIGRELAELLGWAFVDLDEVIEAQEKASIRELFRKKGEAEFRAIERRTLNAVLTECSRPTVLALGGGTFVQADNLQLLQRLGVRSVFLDVPVEELLRRCAAGDADADDNVRPLAADEASFRELYAQRLPAYRGADVVIDATGKSPTEIARKIAAELQAWLSE